MNPVGSGRERGGGAGGESGTKREGKSNDHRFGDFPRYEQFSVYDNVYVTFKYIYIYIDGLRTTDRPRLAMRSTRLCPSSAYPTASCRSRSSKSNPTPSSPSGRSHPGRPGGGASSYLSLRCRSGWWRQIATGQLGEGCASAPIKIARINNRVVHQNQAAWPGRPFFKTRPPDFQPRPKPGCLTFNPGSRQVFFYFKFQWEAPPSTVGTAPVSLLQSWKRLIGSSHPPCNRGRSPSKRCERTTLTRKKMVAEDKLKAERGLSETTPAPQASTATAIRALRGDSQYPTTCCFARRIICLNSLQQ